MSCDRALELVASRRAGAVVDDADWGRAREHLESCGACRRRAEAIDPLLAFRRLPPVEVSAVEVDEMRRRVAAVRRGRRVERVAGAAKTGVASWARTAAAAAAVLLALGAVLARSGVESAPSTRSEATLSDATLSEATLSDATRVGAALAGAASPGRAARLSFPAAGPITPMASSSMILTAELAAEPLLEETDRAFDEVVEWSSDDFGLVLVVDERLDV